MDALMSNDISKERHKFFAGMACRCLAGNFTCCRIERRIQREGSMTVVLESVPFGKEPETQFAIALAPTMRA